MVFCFLQSMKEKNGNLWAILTLVGVVMFKTENRQQDMC